MKLWGIDLGGTKTECAVLDSNREVLIRKRIATEAHRGYEHILAQIKTLVEEVAQELGEAPSCLGFATPGVLEPETRVMKNCNTTCMNGKPMDRDLEALLGVPVRLANDHKSSSAARTTEGQRCQG